ncbi:carbon-nitrogen hydrolase family protein [Guggenheimella bovis]
MKIGLCSLAFKTHETKKNLETMLSTLEAYRGKVDLLLFGESFLQGFEALSFHYKTDREVAVSVEGPEIEVLKKKCKETGVALSFGFIEREEYLYSSQLTIGPDGEILDLFRRVSVGWKESIADEHYKEGEGFHLFTYLEKTFAVGLCGDFWFDHNVEAVRALQPDYVLWPVYTDFSSHEWNKTMKYEYLEQAKKIGERVLYVNSVCYDNDGPERAKGGACYFHAGTILSEHPSGTEGVLVVEC